jgi:hypothetical protein
MYLPGKTRLSSICNAAWNISEFAILKTSLTHYRFYLDMPSGRAASSPQRSGDFSLVLSFGGSKRKNIQGEYLLSYLKFLIQSSGVNLAVK